MPALPEDDEFKPGEDVFEPAPLFDFVRESPVGALIGASWPDFWSRVFSDPS